MKRKRPPLPTLWDAAVVNGTHTFPEWVRDCHPDMCIASGIECEDETYMPPSSQHGAKKHKITKKKKKDKMVTFTIGLSLTHHQQRCMDVLLRKANFAYNWSAYLYADIFRHKQVLGAEEFVESVNEKEVWSNIQKLVVCTKQRDVPVDDPHRDADWYFEGGHSIPALSGFQQFRKAVFATGWKAKNCMKERPSEERLSVGSMQIQGRVNIRVLKCKDLKHLHAHDQVKSTYLERRLSIMPESFGPKTTPAKRFIRVSRRVSLLPPMEKYVIIAKVARGKYRMHIPCDPSSTRKPFTLPSPTSVCSIDPGSRTFATIYNPGKQVAYGSDGGQGENVRTTLLQRIQTIRNALQHARRHNQTQRVESLRNQEARVQRHLRGCAQHAHRTLTGHLVRNYSCVVLGKLGVGSCVRGRNLHKTAKRQLLAWNHYKFRDRLLDRQDEHFRVIVQDESYTSKMCGKCDTIKDNLGGSAIFKCDTCGYRVNRDVNGARNILRKALNLFPSEYMTCRKRKK
jgi:hypothetical protein